MRVQRIDAFRHWLGKHDDGEGPALGEQPLRGARGLLEPRRFVRGDDHDRVVQYAAPIELPKEIRERIVGPTKCALLSGPGALGRRSVGNGKRVVRADRQERREERPLRVMKLEHGPSDCSKNALSSTPQSVRA